MKNVVLGAGGAVANALTSELLTNKEDVRLVSRSGFEMGDAEVFKADLMDTKQCIQSVEGGDVVYLCVGLPYTHKAWKEGWPKLISNTVEACKQTNAKLVFFDNVYMYGKVAGKMTEESPYNPTSKKGELRMRVAEFLEKEMKSGNIKALIARAADIYGPYSTFTSAPYIMVFDKLIKNKKPQWMGSLDKRHSYTYTLDLAKGMYMLAQSDECYGQVWHLPTFNPAPTGREFIEMAMEMYGKEKKYELLKSWVIKMVGFFNKTVHELVEMMYQFEDDYYFDSTKFNSFFNYQPKSYKEGIKESIDFLVI